MNILYLGDNAGSSAEYLKDCLRELEHTVSHISSDEEASIEDIMSSSWECVILSDYPASKLNTETSDAIKKIVEQGARLVMLGGWDSFNGRGTNYYNHPLSEILPVSLQKEDDRVNSPQGLVLSASDQIKDTEPPLDWMNPPIICGYNATESKPNTQTLVWAKPIQSDGTNIALLQAQPLVVKGLFGMGSVITCMTDLAPHWCGGLVDWGSNRQTMEHVEVGDMYINFIKLLLEA